MSLRDVLHEEDLTPEWELLLLAGFTESELDELPMTDLMHLCRMAREELEARQ